MSTAMPDPFTLAVIALFVITLLIGVWLGADWLRKRRRR